MKLRPRVALVSCLVALVSVAVTGALLIAQSRRYSSEQLSSRMLLLAQNRAAALGDSLAVATGELLRLSRMAEVDLTDDDLRPEAQLLSHAHRNSTVFNIGLQIEDANGRCLWSEPTSPDCTGRSFADAPWFKEGRAAKGALVMGSAEQPSIVNLVVPIGGAPGQAAGVLRGIIDVRADRIFAPALTDVIGAGAEVALVSARGLVLAPNGKVDGAGWQRALSQARAGPGTFRTDENGVRWLYAHAPVAHVDWGLVFRWRWAALDDGLQRQVQLLLAILIAGGLLAIVLGLLSSRALVSPIDALVAGVRTLRSRREHPASAGPDPIVSAGIESAANRPDELGELARAFGELTRALGRSDAQHDADLEQIRELASSLEQRVRARTAELESAQRSLLAQERLAAMGQAAAVISHELKNSLGAIGMGVDLITAQADGAGLKRVHTQVREEVTRLRTLTDELLVFARTPRLTKQRGDLNALAVRAAELCRESAASADVELVLELSPGALPASFDAERIQSVLVNLVMNAIEAVAFAPQPAAQRQVRLRTRPLDVEPKAVECAIEDSGPGVPDDARAHLFEPFFTSKRNGTGLGLATAQRFVSAHGGRIELARGTLTGARFVVTLPVEPRVDEPLTAAPSQGASWAH